MKQMGLGTSWVSATKERKDSNYQLCGGGTQILKWVSTQECAPWWQTAWFQSLHCSKTQFNMPQKTRHLQQLQSCHLPLCKELMSSESNLNIKTLYLKKEIRVSLCVSPPPPPPLLLLLLLLLPELQFWASPATEFLPLSQHALQP